MERGINELYSNQLKKYIMLKKPFTVVLLILTTFFFSCVSSKKYKGANNEIEQLKSANQQNAATISSLQKQTNELTAENKSVGSDFSNYKTKCEAAQKEFETTQKELDAQKAILQEEYKTMQQVKDKLTTAMADFANQGVEIFEKDGHVYVNMQDNLLYKSGSATIGNDGKKALEALATALNGYPNLKVIVVGHTDDVMFKKGNDDNLSLSTERANGVTRVLRENNVDPMRLTSAGQGKYHPVGDNTTKEGRAKNRRTEIILNPDLLKLWESVENGSSN